MVLSGIYERDLSRLRQVGPIRPDLLFITLALPQPNVMRFCHSFQHRQAALIYGLAIILRWILRTSK